MCEWVYVQFSTVQSDEMEPFLMTDNIIQELCLVNQKLLNWVICFCRKSLPQQLWYSYSLVKIHYGGNSILMKKLPGPVAFDARVVKWKHFSSNHTRSSKFLRQIILELYYIKGGLHLTNYTRTLLSKRRVSPFNFDILIILILS